MFMKTKGDEGDSHWQLCQDSCNGVQNCDEEQIEMMCHRPSIKHENRTVYGLAKPTPHTLDMLS
jgi:hypothetical protein